MPTCSWDFCGLKSVAFDFNLLYLFAKQDAIYFYRKQYYEEAITLLNKAIKNEKADKTLYKNRGGRVLS